MNNNKCSICNKAIEFLKQINFSTDEFNHHIKTEKIFRRLLYCKECDFVFYQEYFDEEELNNIYSLNYRNCEIYKIMENEFPFHKYAYNVNSIAQLLLAQLYHSFSKGEIMLDIGPGIGYSFWTAKNMLPVMSYEAIELGMQALKYLTSINVKVYNENYLSVSANLKSDYYDFVLLSHSLEHFNSHDLINIMKSLHRILKNNGVLIIEVPLEYTLEQIDRCCFSPDPTHLSFFSVTSLKKILENNLFDIAFIDTSGPSFDNYLKFNYEHKSKQNKFHRKTKNIINNILGQDIRDKVHGIKSIFTKNNLFGVLSNETFQYGGKRSLIRVAAIPKK